MPVDRRSLLCRRARMADDSGRFSSFSVLSPSEDEMKNQLVQKETKKTLIQVSGKCSQDYTHHSSLKGSFCLGLYQKEPKLP